MSLLFHWVVKVTRRMMLLVMLIGMRLPVDAMINGITTRISGTQQGAISAWSSGDSRKCTIEVSKLTHKLKTERNSMINHYGATRPCRGDQSSLADLLFGMTRVRWPLDRGASWVTGSLDVPRPRGCECERDWSPSGAGCISSSNRGRRRR